jgi:hypothetical protein
MLSKILSYLPRGQPDPRRSSFDTFFRPSTTSDGYKIRRQKFNRPKCWRRALRNGREDFEELRPGFGDKLRFELRAEVGEELLNLQVSLRLDGLAVQAIAGLKPLT